MLENIFPWVHYPAIEQELPVIATYCYFTPLQILEIATVTMANGAVFEVTEEILASEYGVTRNESTLEMITDRVDLYDTQIDLVYKNTMEEELTWFNTTHF